MTLSGQIESGRVMQLVAPMGVIVVAAALALTAGCRHHDYARDRFEMRGERMADVVDAIVGSEVARPEMLGRTTDRIGACVALDVRRAPRNLRLLDDYVRSDLDRLRSSAPNYRRDAGRILWGEPESIERNAITLFY